MTAAPLPGSRASVLADHATPGRVASFALHVVFAAALLAIPRPNAPPEPPVVRVDVIPPPAVTPPPPPPPKARTSPRARQPIPPATRAPKPTPPTPDDAEPLPRPTTAPRAEPLAAARTAAAPIAEANQDAPFLAAQAERAESLRPATTAAPALSSMAADTPWIGGAAERTDALAPASTNVIPRDLASARAAPDQLQFAPDPSTATAPAQTPGQSDTEDARKRAEDAARKRAGLNEPKSDRGDTPVATGGAPAMAGGPAGGASGGPAGAAGGGAPATSGGGGVRAAIRGISIDGLNENVGCDNPDDVRLSDAERAECNRKRWAGARGAPQLGAVKARDQRVFDAAAARKTPPTGEKGVAACRASGAAGALDCLPDADPSPKPKR
ncbi:MAG: hypothetical protein KJS97_12245 [Alphaproteobacteria bacterium]|nr:hypothetical protein [Alphaproteobacteria bacterium]